MVPPTINRVRGKSREMRVRDKKREARANGKQAKKAPKIFVKDRGTGAAGIGKKKQKKKEQRARLLKSKVSKASNSTKMDT